MVRRYGESIWAPDWVVSVLLMCGMVACGDGGWQGFAGKRMVDWTGQSPGYFVFWKHSLLF